MLIHYTPPAGMSADQLQATLKAMLQLQRGREAASTTAAAAAAAAAATTAAASGAGGADSDGMGPLDELDARMNTPLLLAIKMGHLDIGTSQSVYIQHSSD
jgi:hypothetical protein